MKFQKLIVAAVLAPLATSALGAELVAGSDSTPAGTVTVTDTGGTLVVEFDAADPLLIFEAHAAAGEIVDGYCDVPQTNKGNPKVGKFEGQEEVGVPGSDPLPIILPDGFPDGSTICIAAHAVVYDPTLAGDDPDNLTGCDFNDDDVVTEDEAFECSEETAWGDGADFDGKNWATWFEFTTGDSLASCPCWAESDLLNVTAENQDLVPGQSCIGYDYETYYAAQLQNIGNSTPNDEGGFNAEVRYPDAAYCSTRDYPITGTEPPTKYLENISVEQAEACVDQIFAHCESIGTPVQLF